MVEQTNKSGQAKQLPGTTQIEEVKGGEEKLYSSGSTEEFIADIKMKLDGIEMNVLEKGLLDRYLQDQETCAKNVLGLLRKLEEKNLENKYALKKIRKVIPLFDEHDFWSTQPVPKYYEQVDASTLD